ncbi:hypothetical protein MRS76_26130 [Rhizobiaceae bacterium n13]|uniref:hypothetical protein n=1 Tax=Ferirhizobium litorale TaxID=2927786 RepID=UPI0024B2D03D|nr:hypothetical protein [Fererhizobium litorale]MDI7865363.1 hypothetical protein [Fererhizobium litorale]
MPNLNEHTENLHKAKRFLIEERRILARKMAAGPIAVGLHASELVALQAAIDAIDRALKDEARTAQDVVDDSYGAF